MSIKSEIKEIQGQVEATKARSGRYVREVWDYIKYNLENRLVSLEKQQEELAKKGNKKEDSKIKPQIEDLRLDIKNLSASISAINKAIETKVSLKDLPNFDKFKELADEVKKGHTKITEEQGQQRKWIGDLGRQYKEVKNTIDSKVKVVEEKLSSIEQKVEFQEPKIVRVVEEKNNEDIYDQIKELESKIERYKKSIPAHQDHRQKFDNIDSELSYLKSDLSKVDKKVSRTDLRDKIDDLYKKLPDENKIYKSIDDVKRQIKEPKTYDTEIQNLDSKINSQESQIKQLDKKISSVDQKDKIADLYRKVNTDNTGDIYKKIEEVKKSIPSQKDYDPQIANIFSHINAVETDVKNLNKKVSRQDQKDKINDLYRKIFEVEKAVSELPISSINNSNKKAEKLEEEIKSLDSKNKNVLQLLQDKDKEISSLKKEVKKCQEILNKEKGSKDQEIEELKQMIFALKEENISLHSKCLDRISVVEEQLK